MWTKRNDSVFHSRLAQACASKGLKITLFTKSQGISSATVSGWKSGVYPGSDIVLSFAQELGVSADYLLGISDSMTPVDGLNSEEVDLLNAWRKAPPVLRGAAVSVLRTSSPKEGGTSSPSREAGMPDAL